MTTYKPNEQDIYDTTPCPICGEYILDEKSETCGNSMCEFQWKAFKEDFERQMIHDIYGHWETEW